MSRDHKTSVRGKDYVLHLTARYSPAICITCAKAAKKASPS